MSVLAVSSGIARFSNAQFQAVLIKWTFSFLEKHSIYSLFLFDRTGVTEAVSLAQDDINANSSILSDIDIVVVRNNDGCHLDAVMRTFINYYVRPDGVLGVLGPPCSETVEPVAGTHFTHTHSHLLEKLFTL